MATRINVSEARATLPEILDRVRAGEEITIVRHGEAVAVVVRPDALTVRRADAALAASERLSDALTRARAKALPPRATLSGHRGQALLADVRASRSSR